MNKHEQIITFIFVSCIISKKAKMLNCNIVVDNCTYPAKMAYCPVQSTPIAVAYNKNEICGHCIKHFTLNLKRLSLTVCSSLTSFTGEWRVKDPVPQKLVIKSHIIIFFQLFHIVI